MGVSQELLDVVEEQGEAFQEFKDRYNAKTDKLEADLEAERKERESLEARINRGGMAGGNAGAEAKTMAAISDVLREAAAVKAQTDVTARLAEVAGEKKAGSVGIDPSGGYAVIADFEARIRTVARDQGAMRMAANVKRVSSDSFEYLIHNDQAGAAWAGETESRTDTDTPEIKKAKIEVHELYAMPSATTKLIEDAEINIASWLADEVGLSFGEKEAAAFIVGDGLLKPRGVTTYPTEATGDSARDWGTFEHVVSGKNGAFADSNPADKIVDLVYKLHPGYRRNARFLMSSEVAGAMRKLKTGDGHFLWQDSIQEGEPARLMGFPVSIDQFTPAMETGSLSIGFGDWSRAYQIIDRRGISVLVDPYTARPLTRFYSTMRVGGDVVDFNAAKFMKFSAA